MTKTSSQRLLVLDALRGIAAIFVVLFHLTADRPQGKYFFNLGLTGVELFFIISGFVIFMTLEKVKTAKEFVISRVTRLFPTYWTCVTITAILILVSGYAVVGKPFFIKYITNLTMFNNYFGQGGIDGTYWTMLIEMIFYIFMLFIFSIKRLKSIEVIGGALLIPLLFYSTYLSYHVHKLDAEVLRFIGLVNFFPLFLSGIVYYKLKFEAKTVMRYVLLGACFITQLTLFHTGGRRIEYVSIYEYTVMLAVYHTLFLLYTSNKLNFIVSPVTVFLGNISYPLYLIHQFISLKIIMPYLTGYVNFWIAAAADIIIVIGLAFLIHKLVEKPAMIYARSKWLKRPKPEEPTVLEITAI